MEEEVFGLDVSDEAPQEPAGLDVAQPQEPQHVPADKPREAQMPDQVPDTYAFADESPEFSGVIGKTASELGLSQDKAQRLLDSVYKAQEEETLRQSKEWVNQAKNDPEIGGANRQQALNVANRAIERYITNDDFKRLLNESGIGAHPEFFRMMYRMGKDMPLEASPRGMFPNSNMVR